MADSPGKKTIYDGTGGGENEGVSWRLLLLEVETGENQRDSWDDDGFEHSCWYN